MEPKVILSVIFACVFKIIFCIVERLLCNSKCTFVRLSVGNGFGRLEFLGCYSKETTESFGEDSVFKWASSIYIICVYVFCPFGFIVIWQYKKGFIIPSFICIRYHCNNKWYFYFLFQSNPRKRQTHCKQ